VVPLGAVLNATSKQMAQPSHLRWVAQDNLH
jgi:hypothetical protein